MQESHGTENNVNYKYRLTTAPPLQECLQQTQTYQYSTIQPIYTQIILQEQTIYLKDKRNHRYKQKTEERQSKLLYAHQRERDRNPERKKHKRNAETVKQKGKRKIDTGSDEPPPRESRAGDTPQTPGLRVKVKPASTASKRKVSRGARPARFGAGRGSATSACKRALQQAGAGQRSCRPARQQTSRRTRQYGQSAQRLLVV
jgi:hypothetical protein